MVDVPVQFDVVASFVTQVVRLVDGIGLSPIEWQATPILVNPPALNVIAVTLLAELHGRMGYFPPVVRLRAVAGSLPPRFEVAEIINLQAVRDHARGRAVAGRISNHEPTLSLTHFGRILLTMGSGKSLWLIVTFLLGAVALGVFSNFIFSIPL